MLRSRPESCRRAPKLALSISIVEATERSRSRPTRTRGRLTCPMVLRTPYRGGEDMIFVCRAA